MEDSPAGQQRSSKEKLRQRLVQAGRQSQHFGVALGGSPSITSEGRRSLTSPRRASLLSVRSTESLVSGSSPSEANRRPSHVNVEDAGEVTRTRTDVSRGSRSAAHFVPWTAERGLAQLPVFEGCRENFINQLASGGEHVMLKPGEFRDLRGQKNPGEGQAVAILVLSGAFRIEIGGVLAEELTTGQAFGLAEILASCLEGSAKGTAAAVCLRATKAEVRPRAGERASLMPMRAPHSCFLLRAGVLRRALQSWPSAQATLQPLLQTFNTLNLTKPLLPALQCNDAATIMLSRSATRHIFCPGETIVTQGKRKYEGVVLLLRGTASLQIHGVEARRVAQGQVVGEEMLTGITSKWRYSLSCLTYCDAIILHRRPFLNLVSKAKPLSSSEEGLECQRLAFLLLGPWREEQVIVSLPLFHGFDAQFLSVLPQRMETRVVMPGHRIWDTTPEERSLFQLLHGTAQEVVTTYKKRRASQIARSRSNNGSAAPEFLVRTAKRTLSQGSCEGGAHMLGLKVSECHVNALSIAVVAVLHRSVFLDLLHGQNVKIQAPEVLKMLEEELDLQEDAEEEHPSVESLELCLPILRGLDEAFMSSLVRGGSSCFYMEGQQLSPPRRPSESLFVILRGEVWTEMGDIFLEKFCQGQALHILALAQNFTPSYASRCIRISEVWDLPREVLMTSLDRYPSMKRILSTLTNMQLSRLTSIGPDSSHPSRSPSPKSPRSPKRSVKPDIAVDLVTLPLLRDVCHEMLLWIQQNLEPRIFFSDSYLFREGDACDSFYIVCKGLVNLESSQGTQEILGIGSSFGEAGLLAVSETVSMTASCLETSLIQVMHRPVFLKGLDRFPTQVEHFDQLAVKLLQSSSALDSVAFLEGCSSALKEELLQRCCTRLLRKGECLVHKSSTRGAISVIRSGSAVEERRLRQEVAETERRFCKYDVVNAEVVLGLVPWAPYNVVVDNFCAVSEIQDTDFINILQSFPSEVPLLVSRLAGLWPLEVEQVPFFGGMSSLHFNWLMEVAEWVMYMPDRAVVRQNKMGEALHLLCYGIAVRVVDDVVLGNPLVQGEVIGRANFLKLTDRYPVTVRAQSVCHFRTLTHSQLLQRLETEFPLREWFELAKVQVRNLVDDHEQQQAEIFRAKMRRRTEQAFNQHVRFTRAIRAKKQGAECKAKILVDQFLKRKSKPEQRSQKFSEDWLALQETYALLRPGEPGEGPSQDAAAGSSLEESKEPHHMRLEYAGVKQSGSWSLNADVAQVQEAIQEFCRQREKERLTARVLRIVRNDYEGTEYAEAPFRRPRRLEDDELARLDALLPAPKEASVSSSSVSLAPILARKFQHVTNLTKAGRARKH